MPEAPVLVTGATGHVGTRLREELVRRGARVRCISRAPRDGGRCEWVEADLLEPETLPAALEGCRAAYYLVHSLAADGGFRDREARSARAFARAAQEAGLERIVYLGGLAHGDGLSDHLASRRAVGEILRESGVLTVELRASIVIGEGSASFDLLRGLVDYLPVLVLPDWIDAHAQPIALDDVVAYLVEALDVDVADSAVFEIGGADRLTYRELLEAYAEAAGVRRPSVAVPAPPLPFGADGFPGGVLSRLVPERARVWAKLIEGLRFDSSVHDERALEVFSVRPLGAREAIERALRGRAPTP